MSWEKYCWFALHLLCKFFFSLVCVHLTKGSQSKYNWCLAYQILINPRKNKQPKKYFKTSFTITKISHRIFYQPVWHALKWLFGHAKRIISSPFKACFHAHTRKPRMLNPALSLRGHFLFLLSLNDSSTSSSHVTLPILISITHGRRNLVVMFSSFKYLEESKLHA